MDYRDFTAFTDFLAAYNVQDNLRQKLIDAKKTMATKARAKSNKQARDERRHYFQEFKDNVNGRIMALKSMRDLSEKFSSFIGSHIMHNIMASIGSSIETLQNIDHNLENIMASRNNKGMVDLVTTLQNNIDIFNDQTFKMNEQIDQIQRIYICDLYAWIKLGKMTMEEAEKLRQNETLTDEQRATIAKTIEAVEKEKAKAEDDQKEKSEQASIDEDNKGKENNGLTSASISHKTRKQMQTEHQIQNQNRKARQKDNMTGALQKKLEKFAKEYVPKEGESYADAVQKIILDYQLEQLQAEIETLTSTIEEIKKSGKKVPYQQAVQLHALNLQLESLNSGKFDINLDKRNRMQDERMIQNQQKLESLQQRLAQTKPKTSNLSRYISALKTHHLENLIDDLQRKQLLIATKQYCMVNTKHNIATRKVERTTSIEANQVIMKERAREKIEQLRALRDRVKTEVSAIYQDYGKPVIDKGSNITKATAEKVRRGISRIDEMLPDMQNGIPINFVSAVGISPELLTLLASKEQERQANVGGRTR